MLSYFKYTMSQRNVSKEHIPNSSYNNIKYMATDLNLPFKLVVMVRFNLFIICYYCHDNIANFLSQ